MTASRVDVATTMADLKDFQRRTAEWAFQRMFADNDPALRFLVADEVGLGKTHVAKGVIAQVIDHLGRTGDKRHDIVYVCSNGAIARQNLRKLVPEGIEPTPVNVDRLTMLPLVKLKGYRDGRPGINLLAITPGTSLNFGASTGRFSERALAYTLLRRHWGTEVMGKRARWIFWFGLRAGSRADRDRRLRRWEEWYRPQVKVSRQEFADRMKQVDAERERAGKRPLRQLFDEIVERLAGGDGFRGRTWWLRVELIAEVRRVMAIVGIDALRPDLVVLDEFQRFKDLLRPEPGNLAAELARALFDYCDPETGQPTRTLLLSATPYRMYTTADDTDADHYRDFLETCRFLYGDEAGVERLESRFVDLRQALTASVAFADPETPLATAAGICREIGSDLRQVMARTERLAATPDRDGMLTEPKVPVSLASADLRSYLRLADLARAVGHHDPTEYWKSAPYLVNFMEHYKLKRAIERAVAEGQLVEDLGLDPGPGLLSWQEVERYQRVDPQNGRLRWLLDDLERRRAFDLLWVPPSIRYYDTGSVYETPEALGFTKRLIFSGWRVVPKVVSSLVSFEAERRAYASRDHGYTTEYRRRGGRRLAFRTREQTDSESDGGEDTGRRRAAAMTTFLLVWPSPSLAELGDPRQLGPARPDRDAVVAAISKRIEAALAPLTGNRGSDGPVDQRWYWAAPLLLDHLGHSSQVDRMLADRAAEFWVGDRDDRNLRAHLAEARAMVEYGANAPHQTSEDPLKPLGRPPEDLYEALAELALGGPAQCALRAVGRVAGLPGVDKTVLSSAARAAEAFRSFFNAPEVTAIVAPQAESEGSVPYWREVVRHCVDGNLQSVLDEHAHVLRDWLGYVSLDAASQRTRAARKIASKIGEALRLRTSALRVDIPGRNEDDNADILQAHRMRTRFAVAFGDQALAEGGQARVGAVSVAFNSPFWPFVLTSTSVGQEGLDFHLWCHAVVHWNLPASPVDLEQREGRVHRYKCHAVRRNIAEKLGSDLLREGIPEGDPWQVLFERAASERGSGDGEMVPYWVFHQGRAKIERLVPLLPFSRESVSLPRLRKSLAVYRLAFGQPRQEELVEFLGDRVSPDHLSRWLSQLRIDLSPPPVN
ncbi:MAG: helicase-related protein [bacterium]|nr:helicase-related protein [bacterium]MDE0601500.1 helicase-related protein [bacterium]